MLVCFDHAAHFIVNANHGVPIRLAKVAAFFQSSTHYLNAPEKVTERLVAAIKKFQPIRLSSKARDDGEADTSIIVTDMLAEVFGYDKFSEVTSEHAIRGTYCDLATKIDGVVQSLIEVKAVGLELKDPNVKQAVDYTANQGVDWVVLTNGLR